MRLTQGQSIWALGRNGEGDDKVRARGVGVNECGTVSSELQNAADNLHHLRGVMHRPEKIYGITWHVSPKSGYNSFFMLTMTTCMKSCYSQ